MVTRYIVRAVRVENPPQYGPHAELLYDGYSLSASVAAECRAPVGYLVTREYRMEEATDEALEDASR